jgi:glucuronokinase
MDFSQAGQERYQSLDSSLLPALHLIYRPAAPSGKDSGSVHSDVKRRWLEGDASVR